MAPTMRRAMVFFPDCLHSGMKKWLLIFLFPLATTAQQWPAGFAAALQAEQSRMVEWRRWFHEHPELSNQEVNTAAKVAGLLRTWGLDVQTGIAKNGVKAILKGGKPGPVIAFRSDMDALPVTENTGLPFASVAKGQFNGQQTGIMHACGHDAHLSILLGTAELLSKYRKDIAGTIVFLFQPAEEGPPPGEKGGASLVVEEGALLQPKVEAIFGLHIMSNIETGTIQYKPGALMASADFFQLTVLGKGSHGANPWLGKDPILVSAQILEGLQHIVSRQEDITTAPVIITVGAINGGVRNNIIPDSCVMLGTVRTLDNTMREDVQQRIKSTAEHIAASAGASIRYFNETKALVTTNPADLARKTVPLLEQAIGKENVQLTGWKTIAEDFSFYGQQVPAFFFLLGGMPKGNDPAKAPPHHTAQFMIEEQGMSTGVKAFCQIALGYAK